ncbi:MAG: LacI family DNA-binding transcriptional regulator [Erysipelotrichaceae bacterium]
MYKEDRYRISDIAEELGLSTATVSNVLNGKLHKVSKETAMRVWKLIEEKGYLPGKADILLGLNDSQIIGIFIDDHLKYEGRVLEDPFISSCVNGFVYEIENKGYVSMLKLTDKVSDLISFSSMWNMAGVVVIGFCEQDYNYLRNNMRIPFVVIDGDKAEGERFCNITIDNFDGGVQAGTYFKNLCLNKALCISDNYENVDRERIDGFRSVINDAEIMIVPMTKEKRDMFYKDNIEYINSFDCIFCVSDYYALEFMKLGLNKPLIGFDDVPLSSLMGLSTVRQDNRLRAKTGIEKLIELIDGNNVENNIVLPVELVIREVTHLTKI